MYTDKLTFDFGWFLDDPPSWSDSSSLDTPPLPVCPLNEIRFGGRDVNMREMERVFVYECV